MTDPSFILELYTIVHSARFRSRWSVLLVPESKYSEALLTISALSDVAFHGRTILWPDTRRKLTVVCNEEVTLPKGEFDLFVAGWAGRSKEESQALVAWKGAAKHFVSTSDASFSSFSLLDREQTVTV